MIGALRNLLGNLGRNLLSGLRLALFLRVDRRTFAISAAQFVLIVLVSAAIDIDTDWVRAAPDSRFSIVGLHGELFALGLLALSSAVIATLRRERDIYLALPIVLLASFPAIQVVHALPDIPRLGVAMSDVARKVFDAAIFAWMVAVAIRAVYVCTQPLGMRRRIFAVGGGVIVVAPLWFAPLIGPLDPWWVEYDSVTAERDAMSPASEPVLAAQDFIMDRALDDLEDERPAVTDLYFVGFAPDARRPGFVADVDAAQRVMDERWHTKGRSIVLVNSPLTVAERPFATITHLRKVLLEIGDLIDTDDDVVMVYLVGSSGGDHTLAAVNPPLELVGLSPQGLKELLDAAGIRWRIVVVSTCYAGAWVDALQDDETVVIASSSANTRASDCTGGIGTSSFGEAFFNDGMRRGDDLALAFDTARKRLARMHAPEPVMSMGPAIAEHLKRLRDNGRARIVAQASIVRGR
ncbi:MAG TPA: C13 family peptidase [Casimicrobiaceae bacterium]|nr:C13 family peptidase [Casimicrobiaceae bacterium]